MDCVCKQHLFRGILARREPPPPLPLQGIVSSGRPETALAGLRFHELPEWGPGIYEAPPLTYTRLVVVAELPQTRDTLLLRRMGAGKVLKQAMAELRALPEDAPERRLAMPILLRLRLEIPEQAQRSADAEESLVSTQDIVEQFIQEQQRAGYDKGYEKGLREGYEKGLRGAVVAFFTARFGAPPEDVAAIVARTQDLSTLRGWLKVVDRAAAVDEVLAAIRMQNGH